MSEISFQEIPSSTDFLVTGQFIELDKSRSNQGQIGRYKRALILGQRLPTGTQEALHAVVTTSPADAERMHGRGSMLSLMADAFFSANGYTETHTLGITDVDDGGIAATKTVTLTGPATGPGQLILYVGGVRVRAGVASGDSASSMATALAAAVNLVTNLPMTAAASSGVVTLTARNAGEVGNDIDIRFNYRTGDKYPPGVAATVVVGVVGSGNPDITSALAAVGAGRYTHIVLPWTDSANLAEMKLFLQARWHALVMNEGLAFTAARGSISDLMDLGDAPNDQTLTIMETSTSPTPPYIWAAQYAAVAAFEPIPNRPLWTLALPGVLPPVLADRRTLPQTNQLLNHGISCHFVDEGGVVRIRRAITTYRVNEWDVPDRSFLDLEKMNLLAELRYLRRVRIAQKFPRCRLTSNTSRQVPGDVVTPDDIRHDFFAQALDWIRLGYIRDDMPALKAAYLCEIDPDDPHRVNELIQPNLVGGLAVYAGLLQFLN